MEDWVYPHDDKSKIAFYTAPLLHSAAVDTHHFQRVFLMNYLAA